MSDDYLVNRIANLSDEELLKMVNEKAEDYTEEAIKLALEEMDRRGLKRKPSNKAINEPKTIDKIDNILSSFFKKKQNVGCLPILILFLIIGFISQCERSDDKIEPATSSPAIEESQQQESDEEAHQKSKIAFSGRFDPTVLSVGEKLVIEFTLKNLGEQPINGFKIAGHGPFKKFTIVNVMPAANYNELWGTYWFESQLEIPPGEVRALSIVAYPNEPGNFEFDFTPYDASGSMMEDNNNDFINIGGKIAVIK